MNKNLRQKFNFKKARRLKHMLAKLNSFDYNSRNHKTKFFFKEKVNTLFIIFTAQKNSANLLAKFIAINLENLVKQNFFLKFLKNALSIFLRSKFSILKGIKIKLKGKFNSARRTREKIIKVGKGIPNLTLNAKIDYSEEISYRFKGTIGVKVWTYRKNN